MLPFTKTVPKICELTTEFIGDIVEFMRGIKDVDSMLFDSIDLFIHQIIRIYEKFSN